VLPIIDTTPPWARSPGCASPWCPPRDPSDFAAFTTAAVERYAPRGIHTWELWNEPNAKTSWQPAPDTARYVTLLHKTVPAIRSADAKAFIIAGSLASSTGSQGIAQLDFLTQFCRLGGNRLVDAIGYHPYSFPVLANNPVGWNAWSKIATTHQSFRSILKAAGTPDLPIWLTEYGAPTNGPGALATNDNNNISQHPDHLSESYQADMATASVPAAVDTPGVGALFWYSDRDLGDDPRTTENFYGLRRASGSAKPAFATLQAAIAARR
jgi:polysaccharide biosynthesis protein PslG